MDIIDTYRTFHPKITEYIFFSSARGTLSRIDHMLRYKMIEIIPCAFSNYSGMKLEVNHTHTHTHTHTHKGKNTNTWRLNNMILYNQGSMKQSK